jgi:RNA polymerase sigma-70 factor (ECF subfamily)
MNDIDTRTDMEIITSCLTGNKDEFTEIVNRYKNLVYSIIRRQTRDTEEANDLAQDVFLKLYKNLKSYTPEYKFSTWVMRITSNHIIDQHRKKRMETVPFEPHMAEGANMPAEPSPESQYLRREQTERINKLLAGLPEMYRVPVVLYHQQDMSYQEIADTLKEPLSKVKNRIFRGRKLLKEMLS